MDSDPTLALGAARAWRHRPFRTCLPGLGALSFLLAAAASLRKSPGPGQFVSITLLDLLMVLVAMLEAGTGVPPDVTGPGTFDGPGPAAARALAPGEIALYLSIDAWIMSLVLLWVPAGWIRLALVALHEWYLLALMPTSSFSPGTPGVLCARLLVPLFPRLRTGGPRGKNTKIRRDRGRGR